MSAKNLIVRGGADFSGLKKEFMKTQQTISNFQKSVSGTMSKVKTVLATIGIGKLVKDSTSVAMKAETSIQQINRMMNVHSNEFLAWANTQALGYGLAKKEAYEYGAVYSNLISSFASDTSKVAQYTQDLLKSSAVVASGTGRTIEDVMDRIRSGMLGSTEAIEDLGINVNIAMIESTDAFKKFANGKSWSQLSFQVQQQIRYFAILEQASKKYGDELNDNTTTRQQKFIAQLKNAQLSLGQAFLPIYNVILPALTSLASKLASVTSVIAQFTQALFGKAQQAQVKFTNAQADAVSGLGDAYAAAGKKAKGSVAGFDEINQSADKTGNSTGDIGDIASGIGGPDLGLANSPQIDIDTTNIDGKLQQLKSVLEPVITSFGRLMAASEPLKTFVAQGFTDLYNNLLVPIAQWTLGEGLPRFLDAISNGLAIIDWSSINDALARLWEAIAPFALNIGEGLLWFWENVLTPLGTWVANEVVPIFLDLLANSINIVNNVIEALKPLGMWLWDKFLLPLAKWTGGKIVDVLAALKDSLGAISTWISKNKPLIETFAIIAGSFAAAWALINVAVTLWNVIAAIAAGVTSAFGAALAFLTSPIGLIILAIGAVIAIVVLLIRHWDDVKIAAGLAWDWIVEVWANAADWFNNSIVIPISNFFKGLWDGIKNSAKTVWDWIVGVWTSAANWFNEKVLQPLITAFTSAWDGIKTGFTAAFEWIKQGMKNFINGYIWAVEGFVNMFIKGINVIINGLNKISFNVPDWVPLIGGKSFGFNLSNISQITLPRLAKGGITNGPMMAMIGDNPGGREVVSPLDDLLDMIASAVGSAMMAAMQFNTSSSSDYDDRPVVLEMDGTKVARGILTKLNDEATRLGYKPILQT